MATQSKLNDDGTRDDRDVGDQSVVIERLAGDSIVRRNLLTVPGYAPYCGYARCSKDRTKWDGGRMQFRCDCGWVSEFSKEFIKEYVRFRDSSR